VIGATPPVDRGANCTDLPIHVSHGDCEIVVVGVVDQRYSVKYCIISRYLATFFQNSFVDECANGRQIVLGMDYSARGP